MIPIHKLGTSDEWLLMYKVACFLYCRTLDCPNKNKGWARHARARQSAVVILMWLYIYISVNRFYTMRILGWLPFSGVVVSNMS